MISLHDVSSFSWALWTHTFTLQAQKTDLKRTPQKGTIHIKKPGKVHVSYQLLGFLQHQASLDQIIPNLSAIFQ